MTISQRAVKKPEIDDGIKWDAFKENSVPLDADRGVKVLSEKTGSDENFLKLQDRSVIDYNKLGILGARELQIRFHFFIRFQFRFLTAVDGLSQYSCLKKKAGYGHEVQARENDRQRGYGKVWDMVLGNYGKRGFICSMSCRVAICFGNQRQFLES